MDNLDNLDRGSFLGMRNSCDKREQLSLLELPSEARIKNEVNNSCDKREQLSLLKLPSKAKIMSEATKYLNNENQ